MADQPTPLQRARGELAAAMARSDAFTRAAQIAVVAQAEAADRQASALERIADHLDGGTDPELRPHAALTIFPPTENEPRWLVADAVAGRMTYVDAAVGEVYLTPPIAQGRAIRIMWAEA